MKPRFGWGGGLVALAGSLLLSTCASTPEAVATEVVSQGEFVVANHGSDGAQGDGGHIATYFTINSVLARIDGRPSRKSDRARVARLPPTTATDVRRDLEPMPQSAEPFGLLTFRAVDRVLQRKWEGAERDMARDQSVLYQCRVDPEDCPLHARQFLRLISAVKAKHGMEQLSEVNQAVNAAIRYTSDMAQFGEVDRWSSALATFATGKGDCEDYVLAKYVALEEAGFPKKDMRVLLVRDEAVGMDHAVLAVRFHHRWLIMDNRWADLRQDTATRTVFTPLFTIGIDGIQMFARPLAKNQIRPHHEHGTPPAGGPREDGDVHGSILAPSENERREDTVIRPENQRMLFADGASALRPLLF
ncbi:MAG: transglutaminase-like cysteine peptidase [Alphaproteobacteria bacterium]|nr:transglutaminase-like cysteine peptidase [Alphaproteobacteria bacterium]